VFKTRAPSVDLEAVADQQLAGGVLTRDQAAAILATPDEELLHLVAAAGRLRRAHFGDGVKLNYLVNLKSGLCPEDCGYCSQRLGSTADVLTYSWLAPGEAVRQASAGIHGGATRVCLVASGRGPTDRDVDRVSRVVGALRDEHPQVEVCACLGLLREGQAERLREAGIDAYNHNVNTSRDRYPEICSTHGYDDRLETVQRSQRAGLSACSGLIVGMGESDDDVIDALFDLRDIGSDSIPVNFLMSFDGTPLQDTHLLTPGRCLRVLALARFACPASEVRMAGGREAQLRWLQPLALHVANSLFLGDYLTSEGQAAQADLDMIADAGFRVLAPDEEAAAPVRPSAPVVRRRGAGTTAAPNA
jgi:biotin synthase